MTKRFFTNAAIILSALFMFGGSLYAAKQSFLADIHQDKGLKCASCHKEEPPKDKVGTPVCLSCHGDLMKVIQRTNNYEPNPHISPHSTNKLVCEECHHAHKKSEISCQVCHVNMEFKKQ